MASKHVPATWNFFSSGELHFGIGVLQQLGEIAKRYSVQSALIVTDPVLVKAGLLDKVRAPLESAGIDVTVFDESEPEPSLEIVDQCVQRARDSSPDAIIGLGGGSNMDVAKHAAAVVTHGGAVRDYLGEDNVPGPVMPLICIPTTAGTGSEVTASTVLTDTENKIKAACLSNHLRPTVALVDPELTISCPRSVTADSGIDTLTHAIEAYTAVTRAEFNLEEGERSLFQGSNAMGDIFAERAIELVGDHLVDAAEQPTNLEAREGMALAATLAGLAFSNVGVGLVHAMEYPLGAEVHCSHGIGNGVLLPYVMRYNLPGREARFARIGRLLGADVRGLDDNDAAELAIEKVVQIRRAIGIPHTISELGAREEHLRPFAEKAAEIKRLIRINPRDANADQIEAVYRESL